MIRHRRRAVALILLAAFVSFIFSVVLWFSDPSVGGVPEALRQALAGP